MRHALVTLLFVAGFTACTVGVGDEDETTTINRAGVRVFNAIVNAPVIGVKVAPDNNVDDAPSFQPLQATQYIGLDSGGFVLVVASGDEATFAPIRTNLGTGASPNRLDAQDRWLVMLSGPPLAPRTPFYRERRNDGQFLIGDGEKIVSPTNTNLRIINGTNDFHTLSVEIPGARVPDPNDPADKETNLATILALDEDLRLNVFADVDFVLSAVGTYTVPPVINENGVVTVPAHDVTESYNATIPALPGGSDATLIAVGIGGGTGANALRFVYLPNRQGSIAPPPVDLGFNPSVVIVNALSASTDVTISGRSDTLTLAAGAASARLQVPENLVITAGGIAVTPVTLDVGSNYVIVLAPQLSGTGVSAYAYNDNAATGTVRAVNFTVGSGARDVTLGATALAIDLVYGASTAVVARPALGALTATTDTSTYTYPVSTEGTPRYYFLTGNAASTVNVIVLDEASTAVVVPGVKS